MLNNSRYIHRWYDAVFKLLLLSFSLPARIQTLILIVCTVFLSMHVLLFSKKENPKQWIQPLVLAVPFLFYLLYFLKTPLSEFSDLWPYAERRVAFFVLPFVTFQLMSFHAKGFRKNLSWFVMPLAIQTLGCDLYFLFEQIVGKHRVDFREVMEVLSGKHPTYFSLHLALLLFILWTEGKKATFNFRFLWMICLVLALVTLLFLSAKIILLVVVLGFVYALATIFSWKRKVTYALVLVFILAFTLLLLMPYTQYRLQELSVLLQGRESQGQWNTVAVRQLIYSIDWSLVKAYGVFGIGPVRLQEALNFHLFQFAHFAQLPVTSYNTHNEYFNQWLCFGIVGLLYFLYTLSQYWRKALREKNHLFVLVVLLMTVAMCTENILSRQHGVVCYALWLGLFYFETPKTLPLDVKGNIDHSGS